MTALKTISMRLRNTSGELEEMGEDADGAAESVTKLQQQLLGLTNNKVNIMLDENTFRSTYDIMVDLSKVWDELTDKQHADITRLVSGVRQGNVLNALITNMKDGINATATALESSGSAMKENENVLEGIEGKTRRFNTTFEALSQTIINTNAFKFLIDTGSALISVLSKLTGFMGGIPALIVSISVAMSVLKKNSGKIYAPLLQVA